MNKLLVYDVGMNNGDDVEYYLKKGCRVIGVEANPALCEFVSSRFADARSSGDLRVINCAVAGNDGFGEFYVNATNHVLSTLVRPACVGGTWSHMTIPLRRLSSIIKDEGSPYYIKIDVEQMDHVVLADLLTAGIFPPYISAESHVIDTFCLLVSMGYEYFNLIDGRSVHEQFERHAINLVSGDKDSFTFAPHSSGPFGDDIPWPWLTKEQLLGALISAGLGWRDIHATTTKPRNCADGMRFMDYAFRSFGENLRDLVPSFMRAIRRRASVARR